VADDQALDAQLGGHRLDGEAVEAVAPDSPILTPLKRDRVGCRLLRNRGHEGGIEDCDMRHARQGCLRLADRAERRIVVQRRKRPQLVDRRENVVVDWSRPDEVGSAVDDAVPDRLRR
jgi:hypothetical protein